MAPKHDILYVNFYTDGSAARKIAPAFPETQTGRKPRTARQKKTVIYFDPVAVCSLLVAVILLVMMAVGLTQFQQARAQTQMMEQYVEQLSAENKALQAEYDAVVDLEEVEKTAVALGMVSKDQIPSTQVTQD